MSDEVKELIFKDKEDFKSDYNSITLRTKGKPFAQCNAQERYEALAILIGDKARENGYKSAERASRNNLKRVYYFSMEFLIGKILENYLINFNVLDLVRDALQEMGQDIDELFEVERDAGLGNGGLGRLAACFIDSLATCGYDGQGMGIRYSYGFFKQEIVDGHQVEVPDDWLAHGYPWELRKANSAVVVHFGGQVKSTFENGEFKYTWEDTDDILAVPYDVPVVGYGGETVNRLRLWSSQSIDDHFDMEAFNRGDYAGALKHRVESKAISYMLYPNDSTEAGKILRLKQEYMLVAAGIANIVRVYKRDYGENAWNEFGEHVAIHTNDTHPSLCAPELLRVLIDEEHLTWDEAWKCVSESISYTNHTVLPEAVEKWPIDLFERLLPRVYDFVEEIDRRYREKYPKNRENWKSELSKTAILWDGMVRTANLSVIVSHSVNGVAELHTEILKNSVLSDFYQITPEKFNNKTNGISPRRFLLQANPSYSSLIKEKIGTDWIRNTSELTKLLEFENDGEFIERVKECKHINKVRLANYIKETSGIEVDPNSIFDIQVKRFHAYKRQLLNLFKIMAIYDHLLEDPNYKIYPTTFIFSGKAAPSYVFAKDCIRLVNAMAEVINNDNRVNKYIKIAFVPNFSVSNAQLIYPAADISEQISTAGMEASGTGNMKFMMNGAVTLGTDDGANVEIHRLVGNKNIEIFGLSSEEIENYRYLQNYSAWEEYQNNKVVKKIVDHLLDDLYSKQSGNFINIYNTLMRSNDEFFVLKDFETYMNGWHHLNKLYEDSNEWARIALHNTALSGYFSSDRTIEEYSRDIWHLNK